MAESLTTHPIPPALLSQKYLDTALWLKAEKEYKEANENKFAKHWLPIEEMSFWREFKVKFPSFADSMWKRAEMALGVKHEAAGPKV